MSHFAVGNYGDGGGGRWERNYNFTIFGEGVYEYWGLKERSR